MLINSAGRAWANLGVKRKVAAGAVSTEPVISEWLRTFAARELEPASADNWARDTAEAILAAVPEITRVPGAVDGIVAAVRAHWATFLSDFCEPQLTFHLPHQAQDLAVAVSRSQLPLETLIRLYRVAQRITWDYITRVVGAIGNNRVDRADILIYFWDRASSWIDHSISTSVELFHRERDRARNTAEARRFETVRAVLSGDTTDARKISAELGGYPMSAHHTAVLLACQNHDNLELMDLVARAMARAVGASQPLLVRPGGRRLWCWIATRDRVDTAALAQAFHDVEHGDLRVAIGSTQVGIPGFVVTHDQSKLALDAVPSATTGNVLAYEDAELLVLLGCSAQVDNFVRRMLGELLDDTEDSHRLRQTLAAYLECGGNVDAASRQLTVHRNTVRYRLGRAEEVLGRPIAKISPELTMSLRHAAAYHLADSEAEDRPALTHHDRR